MSMPESTDTSTMLKPAEQIEAEGWYLKAEILLARPTKTATNTKLDDTLYYFGLAAHFYRLIEFWEEAGNCCAMMAHAEISQGNKSEASTYFWDAAVLIARGDPEKGREMYVGEESKNSTKMCCARTAAGCWRQAL